MVLGLVEHFVGDGQLVDRKGRYLIHLQFDHALEFLRISRGQFEHAHQQLGRGERNRHNAAKTAADSGKHFRREQRRVFLLKKAFRNRQGAFADFFRALAVFTQHSPLDDFVGVVNAGCMSKKHHSDVFPSSQNRGTAAFSPSLKMQEI